MKTNVCCPNVDNACGVYQQPVQEVGGSDVNCEETVVSDNDVIQPQEGDPVRSVSPLSDGVSIHPACDAQKPNQTKKLGSVRSLSSFLRLCWLYIFIHVWCTDA